MCLLLLQNGAKVSQKLLFKACQYGCEETVQYMINSGTNVNATSERGENALMYALNGGGIGRLKRKLACVTDVESLKSEAYEILQRDVNMLHLLCESGCDLQTAAIYRSWKIQNLPAVIVLLKHGASFDLNNRTLKLEYVNDTIYDELCELYLTFIATRIPEEVVEKRRIRIFSINSPFSQKYASPVHVTPLQQLCRLIIRNALKSSRVHDRSIIISINKMAIAPRLKQYLCYSEITEMSSYYGHKLFCSCGISKYSFEPCHDETCVLSLLQITKT